MFFKAKVKKFLTPREWPVKSYFNHWFPKRLGVGAIVLYPFIFYSKPFSYQLEGMVKHEWCHIKQIRSVGVFRYYSSYLLYYLAGRLSRLGHQKAYRSIPWEVFAYKVGP